jgi:signal transduction histidine kinase/DNA-binding response OmpR family regulator
LKQSQSLAQQLQTRQEQLQQTNQELQEKARLLAQQNQEVERKNSEVEQARQELEEKAKQLALTSKYKSEFLANMSHELRTPLNSLLILSDQLSKNTDGNLSPKQTEFAKTIHSSGNDLLMLINDILDLSKIESGTVMVDASDLRLADLHGYVSRTFKHVAESKGLEFNIRFDARLPKSMTTDAKRLQQIIKNLLSNAFKFTHHGQVTLSVEVVSNGWSSLNDDLNRAAEVIAFSVSDTGIGISSDKQQIIFEAFQQADGSTSRKYGGTGLGLAISRELSRLLGGEIRLASSPGRGSIFTLYLPTIYASLRALRLPQGSSAHVAIPSRAPRMDSNTIERWSALTHGELPEIEGKGLSIVNEAGDDRDAIHAGDRSILIVENDLGFARIILDSVRSLGLKGLVTSSGAAALDMTLTYKPQVISLDMHLSDIDGWRVLERLKNDMSTRHIPVCVISTDDAKERALDSGAVAFLAKPINSLELLNGLFETLEQYIGRETRYVLVVEADPAKRKEIVDTLAADEVRISTTASVAEAASSETPDCVVLGSGIDPAEFATAFHTIGADKADSNWRLPVIIFEGSRNGIDRTPWNRLAEFCTVRWANSPERLFDFAAISLHLDTATLPESKRAAIEDLHRNDLTLEGKKVLIVDDDMRNIFALSTVLEEYNMSILSADNGRDAIKMLDEYEDVDVVLMDIMMPEMDGMETMREIRKNPRHKKLPIVAVTAKAMKGDREKCIEAGAWDYLSKPVDTEQMLSVLKAWMK